MQSSSCATDPFPCVPVGYLPTRLWGAMSCTQGTCKRATSVEYMAHGQAQTIVAYARKEIILSGGFSESPKLLLMSGIGNRTELYHHFDDVEDREVRRCARCTFIGCLGSAWAFSCSSRLGAPNK